VATVVVVAIHAFTVALAAPQGLVAWRGSMAMQLTFWVATPAFAFLTGALVWTMTPPRTLGDYRRFFLRRASIVLVPFLVWSVVYIVFARPLPRAATAAALLAFAVDSARRLVLGTAWYHLYFVPVVVQLYLWAPLVSRFARRFPAALLAAAVLLGGLHGYVPAAPSPHLVGLRTAFVAFVWFLPFAAAGAWYSALRPRLEPLLARAWPLLLASGLLVRWRDLAGRFMPEPFSQRSLEIAYMLAVLFGLLGALEALRRVAPLLQPAARALASTSFTVYLAHPLLLLYLQRSLTSLGADRLWGYPAFAFAVIAGLVLACHFLARLAGRFRATAWIVRGPVRRLPPPVSLPLSPSAEELPTAASDA
jgi:surface polysaccharide O-acyltransferase-like enzyme